MYNYDCKYLEAPNFIINSEFYLSISTVHSATLQIFT